jgi:hypothetical protein
MYPFYNVSANTSDMHRFADQNGCVVPSKEERESASKKWIASSSNEMSRAPGADIDTPMTPIDAAEMTHTGMAGHSYNVPYHHLSTFDKLYCDDVYADFVHGFEKKVYSTPQLSLNEFGHPLAFPMFFDIDLALFGPPEAIDQSIIALICCLLHLSMRAFWPHLSDEEWLTVGEMYVTQSLARVKDPLTFLRKCKDDIGKSSNHRTRKGAINTSPNNLMMDESANDGFMDPFGSSTPPSLSSSIDAASFFSSSLGFNPMASSSTSGSNTTISCASTPPSLNRSSQIFKTGLSTSSSVQRGVFFDHALSMPAFTSQQPATSVSANKEAENEAFFTAAMIDMKQRMPGAIVEHKIGLHIHFPNTAVRADKARRIRMYIVKVIVSQIVLNSALVNLTRICMFTNKPFERDALTPAKTTALVAEKFWLGVIEDVYDGPLPHCKKVFSHKMNKSGCVNCALAQFESQPPPAKRARGRQQTSPSADFQVRPRDSCQICNGWKKMAIGPAAVSDLVYALDGSGKPLPLYSGLTFDPSVLLKPATRNNYVDVGLARVASAAGIPLDKALLEPQPRYTAISHERLRRLLTDNPVCVECFSVDMDHPSYMPISELPLPLRRFSAFRHQSEQLAYISEVVAKTSIRLHNDAGGMSEAAWEQLQRPVGFTFPKSSVRIGDNQSLDPFYNLNKPLSSRSKPKYIPALKLAVKTDLINHLKALDCGNGIHEWRNVSFQTPYFLSESVALPVGRHLLNDHRLSVLYTGNAWIFEAVGIKAHYCTIIGKCHTNNTIYLKITPMHIIQLCHSKSGRQGAGIPCASTFGKIWRLPERFRAALFVNPKGEAAKLIAEVTAIWNSPAINFNNGQSLIATLGAVVPPHVSAATASSSNAQATLESEERTLRNAGYILPGSNSAGLNRSAAVVTQQPSLVFSLAPVQSSSPAPILPSNNNLFM